MIGNPDSKYTYNPEQFEIDVSDKMRQHENFKRIIKDLILYDPSSTDLRYYDTIEALKELKEEYNL